MACGASSAAASSCGASSKKSRSCGASASSSNGGGCSEDAGCGKPVCCEPIPDAAPQSIPAAPKAKKSAFEKKLLCASCPADISETETITVNGVTGIFVNKSEVDSFNGPIPIEDYEIFDDPNPKVINKVCQGDGEVQQVQVKFLVAPAGPEPGDIVVRERAAPAPGPAPPVIIRQEAAGGCTGKPKCYRECPPKPCPKICPQLIEVCAPSGAPPPRKVIIEKLPAGGATPGPIYAERWLSSASCQTRNVIFEPAPQAPSCGKVKNVIINWTRNEGTVKIESQSLGKEEQCPCAYKKKYGKRLSKNIPESVKSVKPPKGTKLAGTPNCDTPTLVGCVSALKNVDLAAHGLEAYADQIKRA